MTMSNGKPKREIKALKQQQNEATTTTTTMQSNSVLCHDKCKMNWAIIWLPMSNLMYAIDSNVGAGAAAAALAAVGIAIG